MNVLKELARDSFFSFIVYLAPRFANVVIFIVIGRLAGPDQAGVFSLAATYLLILTTILRGLDDMIIRQVSREPDQAPSYLTNFLVFRLGMTSVLYGCLWLIIRSAFHYSEKTSATILILALCLAPDSLAYVSQAVLYGLRRFAAPAVIMTLTTVFKLIGGGLLLLKGGSISQVAWLWLFGSLVGMAGMVFFGIRSVGGLRAKAWLNWRPLLSNWSSSWPFIVITLLMTIETQTDTVVLSAYQNEAQVGWYNAATTVAYSLAMIAQAFRMSIYPIMTRYALTAPEKLARLHEQSLRYLGMLALPMSAGIALLAPQIVTLVYTENFLPTVAMLRILMPVLVFMFLNVPSARIMYVYDRQKWSSWFILVSAITNIMLNLLLDRQMGGVGAAVARLSSSSIFFLLTYLYVNRSLAPSNILRLLLKPSLATLAMCVGVWLIRSQWLFLPIVVGGLIYFIVLWLVGGISTVDITLLRTALHLPSDRSAVRRIG